VVRHPRICFCKSSGRRSVAAVKSKDQNFEWPLSYNRRTHANWSNVPSVGRDRNNLSNASWSGLRIDCVHASVIAKTRTLPAASSFLESLPKIWRLPIFHPSLIELRRLGRFSISCISSLNTSGPVDRASIPKSLSKSGHSLHAFASSGMPKAAIRVFGPADTE